MGKQRSRFTRLGAHVARNRAREVRERASTGDPAAARELQKLEAGLTLAGLQDKNDDILSQMLVRVARTLADLGHPGPPLTAETSVSEHGLTLLLWAKEYRADPDSLEGRMIEVLRLCAHALIESDDDKADFLLGLVLGYGIAQKYFLAFREYSDGPALARDAVLQTSRADGGKRRAKKTTPRDTKIRAAFDADKAKNPSLTPNGWADDHASQWGLGRDRVGRILRAKSVRVLK